MSNTKSVKSNDSIELCKDIVATASLLIKFDSCHILDSQSSFVEFLNAAEFRTVRGKEFSKMSFRQMWSRLPKDKLEEILSEFDSRNYDILAGMMGK